MTPIPAVELLRGFLLKLLGNIKEISIFAPSSMQNIILTAWFDFGEGVVPLTFFI